MSKSENIPTTPTEAINAQTLDAALSHSFFCGDLGQEVTVRGYLLRLLSDLWRKEESFNGKRPFGNSGWQWEVYEALIEAGYIPGELDEDGGILDFDEEAASAFMHRLIWHLDASPAQGPRA